MEHQLCRKTVTCRSSQIALCIVKIYIPEMPRGTPEVRTCCRKRLPNPSMLRRKAASPSFGTPPYPSQQFFAELSCHQFPCTLLSIFRAFRSTLFSRLFGTAPNTVPPSPLPSTAVRVFWVCFCVHEKWWCSSLFRAKRQDLFTLNYTRPRCPQR